MTSPAQSPLAREIAGALDWWREAGIDADFADEAKPWLKEPVEAAPSPGPANPAAPAPVEAPQPKLGGDRGAWPSDLSTFAQWWLTDPNLFDGSPSARVAPRGPAAAALMVLVSQPEAEDTDNLLSGPQGKLLEAMLQAMGIPQETVYFASVLPRHTPLPDWDGYAAAGLGEVLAHHIGLAAPQRLIAFGQNILPLLGHDPTKTAESLRGFNHEGRSIPLLPAMELGVYQTAPRRKAALWQRWLDWTG